MKKIQCKKNNLEIDIQKHMRGGSVFTEKVIDEGHCLNDIVNYVNNEGKYKYDFIPGFTTKKVPSRFILIKDLNYDQYRGY